VLGQQTGVSNTSEVQRPPEGAAPLCQREASRIGMHMCSPPRQSPARIGQEPELRRNEPQQLDGRRA
jgi:hypothetical protein